MDKGGQTLKNKLTLFAALCGLFVLVFASRQAIESCRYGLTLCLELIIPSLFPFFFLSILLSRLGFPEWLGSRLSKPASSLFHVSGNGITALFIGLCGGYPMGAAYLADLIREGLITQKEAEHLLAFCNNSGPAFLIGAIGAGVFESAKIGLVLYLVHVLSALLCGILLRDPSIPGGDIKKRETRQVNTLSHLLPEAVEQTVSSLLNVCGFVVCFSVFTGLLNTNGIMSAFINKLSTAIYIKPQPLQALLFGFFELGSGIGALQDLPPTPLHLAIASAVVGWGGISVHFQTYSVLADTDIKGTLHTAGRLFNALFSFILSYSLFSFRS